LYAETEQFSEGRRLFDLKNIKYQQQKIKRYYTFTELTFTPGTRWITPFPVLPASDTPCFFVQSEPGHTLKVTPATVVKPRISVQSDRRNPCVTQVTSVSHRFQIHVSEITVANAFSVGASLLSTTIILFDDNLLVTLELAMLEFVNRDALYNFTTLNIWFVACDSIGPVRHELVAVDFPVGFAFHVPRPFQFVTGLTRDFATSVGKDDGWRGGFFADFGACFSGGLDFA